MNSFFQKYARQTAFFATASLAGVTLYNDDGKENDSQPPTGSYANRVANGSLTRCEKLGSSAPPANKDISSKIGTKLLFLGSGSSTGCPKPICALTFPQSEEFLSKHPMAKLQKNLESNCKISRIANVGDPRYNKNYRNNPSLLISHRNNDHLAPEDAPSDKSELKNVIIDVGKTFREGALRWMPHHGIYRLDSIVLTHEHADAFLGLDDLRGFQIYSRMLSPDLRSDPSLNFSLPVYLSPKCFEVVKKAFGYLVPKELREEGKGVDASACCTKDDGPKVVRHVASLDFQTVEHFKPFYAAGLKMVPLPAIHGEDFICNGYAFSVKGDEGRTVNVVYLSDISRMLPETEKFILDQLPPTDILVVDTLLKDRNHSVHFSLNQALALVERLDPKKTYLVGINCDDFPEHEEANRVIKKRNSTVELAHDGLAIEL